MHLIEQAVASSTIPTTARTRLLTLTKLLHQGGHILNATVDELLCSQIETVPIASGNEDEGRTLESAMKNPLLLSAAESGLRTYASVHDEEDAEEFSARQRRVSVYRTVAEEIRRDGPPLTWLDEEKRLR